MFKNHWEEIVFILTEGPEEMRMTMMFSIAMGVIAGFVIFKPVMFRWIGL